MLRRWLTSLICTLPLALALAAGAAEAEAPFSTFARVTIEPTKTSIYIGTVAMTMPPFVRKNGTYESTYAAKVFPYFFSNEKGTLAITLSDESLRKLERGEPVEFSGRAVNTVGEERRGGRDSRGVAQNGLDHLGASVVETYYAHTQAR